MSNLRRVNVPVYRCRFMNGPKCTYVGENLPSGAHESLKTVWCEVPSGDRNNLNRCDIGGKEESVIRDEVLVYLSPGGMMS